MALIDQDAQALSRILFHALRHSPERYFLEIDADGWVNLEHLLLALRHERPEWSSIGKRDIERAIGAVHGRRIEFRDGCIRALYGHSVALSDPATVSKVPPLLYHGTIVDVLPQIQIDGLRPMARRFVHLTSSRRYAFEVASTKSGQPAVLEINAAESERNGVSFRRANEHVWLADSVPVCQIRFPDLRNDGPLAVPSAE